VKARASTPGVVRVNSYQGKYKDACVCDFFFGYAY
jgi:hypothetical protein